MTLFAAVAAPGAVFGRVLEQFFDGHPDERTLELLARSQPGGSAAQG